MPVHCSCTATCCSCQQYTGATVTGWPTLTGWPTIPDGCIIVYPPERDGPVFKKPKLKYSRPPKDYSERRKWWNR
jgi:hypothetical protein